MHVFLPLRELVIGSFSLRIFNVTENFLKATIEEHIRYTRRKRSWKRSQKASKSLVYSSRELASLDDFESK